MEPTLNVDRYLTQRVGVVRRLLDADVPPAAAERWVTAWEEEAQRRGLDPADGDWWRPAWGWIAQDRGRSKDPAGASPTSPEGIRLELPILVVTTIQRTSDMIAAFRAWLDARVRDDVSAPGAPDHEWLRREMERMCGAYEAAIGQGKRRRRRPHRARPTAT
jgi:hypothetical protein